MAGAADRTEADSEPSAGERSAVERSPSELDGIELADAIASVRDQLVDAATRSADRRLTFEVGPIEMEFTLELRREGKGGAKVKAWVIEAGADAARSTARTHRVAFTLTPRDAATGGPWLVGNADRGDVSHFGVSS